jgi:predicted ArsR family transcriptional regulator
LKARAIVGHYTRTNQPSGRPRGDVSRAIVKALEDGPPMTLRDVAARCQIGYLAARWTLKELGRAGAVEIVGREKRAHSKKWVALYAPAGNQAKSVTSQAAGLAALSGAVASWTPARTTADDREAEDDGRTD